jgi:hypothetical protein
MSSIEAVTENLTIRRNRTFREEYSVFDGDGNPLNLTGYIILAECRKEADEPSTTDPLFTFNIDTSDIANGNIAIFLSEVETKALAISTGVWDMLFIAQDGTKESWIDGTAAVVGSVTHLP